jgi:chloramphenicol-sensitive protein RarD
LNLGPTEQRRGLAAALGAYLLWGVFPLYFIAVAQVPTLEIVANRIFWSAVLVVGLVLLSGQGPALWLAFTRRRQFWGLVASAGFITINWGFFAWAVPHGHALDAGFGYLINPLVVVLLAFVVLRERMSRRRMAAVALALAGVAALAVYRGGVPWVVLVLPVSFAFYGLVRKLVPVPALVGLAVEVALLAPVAGIYLATRPGGGALFGQGLGMTGMMLLAAPVTAAPLALFAYGARRLPLSTMGFLQYVAPSIQVVLATVFFGEAFTTGHAIAFGLIWAGIVLYSWPQRRLAAPKPVDFAPGRGHMAEESAGAASPTANPEAPSP